MKRSMMVLSGLGCVVGVASGQGTLLYDIDFSEPFHTFGAVAALDTGPAPREGFSAYAFTDPGDEPVVDGVYELRAMTGGVAVFGAEAQGRMQLEDGADAFPGIDFDVYTLEFDAAVLQGGYVTVFFDSPSINRFYMGTDFPDDGVGAIKYGSGPIGTEELAGFTFGEFLAVRVTLDTVGQRWRIEVDGEVLYEGPTQNAVAEVRNARLIGENGAFIDNITITGEYTGCGVADVNGDGLLDLRDVTGFVESFLDGCG